MKKTLLAMTQDILSEMDSDSVNSINDTVESQQVASIIKNCFAEMISNRNWPHLRKLVQLEGLGDTTKPNYLRAPTGMKELLFFKYDTHKAGETRSVITEIAYKEPEEFLRYVSMRDSTRDDVDEIVDFSGSKLMIITNEAPRFWTTFDDKHIVVDSYNKAVDSTLQASKTQCLAYLEPQWVHSDTAIPELPVEAFSALEEEAKSNCFFVLKQMANPKAEQKASRQGRWLARKAWTVKGGIQYENNYGRKR